MNYLTIVVHMRDNVRLADWSGCNTAVVYHYKFPFKFRLPKECKRRLQMLFKVRTALYKTEGNSPKLIEN